jgi:hypothetical protein
MGVCWSGGLWNRGNPDVPHDYQVVVGAMTVVGI